ncbi:MAG: TIGR01777 family oxidoreductase [Nitrosomonadales bacterium]
MNILMTGGTGLIGRALCKALLAEGHQLTVLSRQPATVPVICGDAVQALSSLDEWRSTQHFDAVINLAGAPIADAAWREARKQVLRGSRIGLTEKLVQRIACAAHKPTVLLSGSAVGYYGNRPDVELDEQSAAGADFAARLCADWENAALQVEGVRVCLLRTGLVLSAQGGLLGRMLLPFKLAMGARLGNGRQGMSWVHIDDYVAMVLRLLHDEQLSGPFNMTAPHPVSNAEFTRQLAQAIGRPAMFVMPGCFLRWLMGERAVLLLEGQRVLPVRMQAAGFKFSYPDLTGALSAVLAASKR